MVTIEVDAAEALIMSDPHKPLPSTFTVLPAGTVISSPGVGTLAGLQFPARNQEPLTGPIQDFAEAKVLLLSKKNRDRKNKMSMEK